jgi:hypothetical protein
MLLMTMGVPNAVQYTARLETVFVANAAQKAEDSKVQS